MGLREQIIRLSIFFFLLFTPFSSYLTILTHIYEEKDLPGIGPATLAVNYTCFMISLAIAPALHKPLKMQILSGGIFYTLNYSSGIFVTLTDEPGLKYLISCVGAGIAGMSSGFMWVSHGRYIHFACERAGESSRKGEMYGMFNSICCFSNVSAGLIITFGLGFFNILVYFFIITAFGVIAILFGIFFVRDVPIKNEMPLKNESLLEEEENGIQNTQVQGKIEEDKNERQGLQQNYNAWKAMKETVKFIPTMYPVLIVLVIDGLAMGFYSSEIPHLIPSDTPSDIVDKMTGITNISMGVGATLCGFLSGFISDKLGELKTGRIGLGIYFFSCLVVVVQLFWPSLWLANIAAFLWGFQLFFIEAWMYIVCSRCYGGKSSAFSVNKGLHCLFYLLTQLVVFATSNKLPLKIVVPVISILALPAVLLLPKLPNLRKVQ